MKFLSLSRQYFPLKRISLLLCFLVLTGCAEFNSGWNQYSPRYSDSYAQSDFDELLAFGDNMAKSPTSSRTKICRSLLKRPKASELTGVLLHLMVGRLLSDACGDVSKILEGLKTIPPSSLDTRMQKLVSINTEALKRIYYNGSKKQSTVDCKQKTSQSSVGSKSSSGSKSNETRLLREKLEAIRSMEKQMDETSDGQ